MRRVDTREVSGPAAATATQQPHFPDTLMGGLCVMKKAATEVIARGIGAAGGGGRGQRLGSELLRLMWMVRKGEEPLGALGNAILQINAAETAPISAISSLTTSINHLLEAPLAARQEAITAWHDVVVARSGPARRWSQTKVQRAADVCWSTRQLAEHIWLLGSEPHKAAKRGTSEQQQPGAREAEGEEEKKQQQQKNNNRAKTLCPDTGSDHEPLLVQEVHDLQSMLDVVTMDISSLTVEKHGVSPRVHLNDALAHIRPPIISIPVYLDTILRELLKNAFAATVAKHGIDADEAPPIDVQVTQRGRGLTRITIADHGPGVPLRAERQIFDWFFTSQKASRDPTYTFSGDFGGTLAGEGVGLPLARTHARLLGGDIALSHVYRARGASFHLDLPTVERITPA